MLRRVLLTAAVFQLPEAGAQSAGGLGLDPGRSSFRCALVRRL